MKFFDDKIKKVIDLFSHPVWIISTNKEIDCSCVDFTTKVPEPGCKKCLGLGKKVTITRVYASNQNSTVQIAGLNLGRNEKDIGNVYYTYGETNVKSGDMVVDKRCIDIVKDVYYERSDASDIVYWRIETTPKKNNSIAFKNAFQEILKKAGYDYEI